MVKEYIINSNKYGKQIVLLDDEDYDRLQKYNHHLLSAYDKTIKGFYVHFKVKHLEVDHINHNTLDNRKCNLRKVTTRENQLNKRNNTSGCPGVRWHSQGKKWNARITIKGKEKSLGMFNTFEEAVKARYEALKEVM